MEQTLKRARKELEDLKFALDQSSILAITDAAGIITFVNDKFCEISKYDRNELLNQNHRILNSKYHSREFFVDLWKTISKGKVWKGEIKNRAKDDSYYWVFTTIIPFLDDELRPYQYLSVRMDITEQKLAQQQKEHDRAIILNSEKLASLGEIAAGIAHELGNPIAIIRGRMEFLEMQLLRSDVSTETILKTSRMILDLTDRMTRIIRSMRSLSRDGSTDPFARTSIQRIALDVLELSRESFSQQDVSIRKVGLDGETEIDCRETQISQVIMNLINNARDAVQGLESKWIEVQLNDRGKEIEICITDSGGGISPEIQARIMDPFFTTKEYNKGSGLGLSISKSIVEKHHGRLFLDTTYEHTRFVVVLPKNQSKPH